MFSLLSLLPLSLGGVTINSSSQELAAGNAQTLGSSHVIEDLNKAVLVSVGRKDRPAIQVTVFTDFQCPYCRDLDASLRVLEDEADMDSLEIIFRSFPKAQHPWAMQAAVLATCGAEQKQRYYFDLSSYFYAHQQDLEEATVYSTARDLLSTDKTFDVTSFDHCVTGGTGARIVGADIALGLRSGVVFTPTLFLNDRKVVGSKDLATLRTLLKTTRPLPSRNDARDATRSF